MLLDLGFAAEGIERGGCDDAGGTADLFHDLDIFQDALGLGVDDADQERDAAVDDAHGFALDLCTTLGRREGDLTGRAGDEQTVEARLDHAVDVTLERRDVELAVLERDSQGRDNATDLRRHTYFSPSRVGCRSEGAAPRSLRV